MNDKDKRQLARLRTLEFKEKSEYKMLFLLTLY